MLGDELALHALLTRAMHRGDPLAAAFSRWLGRHPVHDLPDVIASSIRVEHVHGLDVPGREVALVLARADTRAGDGISVPLAVELVPSPAVALPPGSGGASVIATLRGRGGPEPARALLDVSSDPGVASALGRLTDARPGAPPEARHRGPPGVVRLVGRAEAAPLPEVMTAAVLMASGAPIEPVLGSLDVSVGGRIRRRGVRRPGQ